MKTSTACLLNAFTLIVMFVLLGAQTLNGTLPITSSTIWIFLGLGAVIVSTVAAGLEENQKNN